MLRGPICIVGQTTENEFKLSKKKNNYGICFENKWMTPKCPRKLIGIFYLFILMMILSYYKKWTETSEKRKIHHFSVQHRSLNVLFVDEVVSNQQITTVQICWCPCWACLAFIKISDFVRLISLTGYRELFRGVFNPLMIHLISDVCDGS